MKKIFIVLVVCCIALCLKKDVQAQIWSTQAVFNPHSTTLIGDASRFGYYYNSWSNYYMRYNDSAYFCSLVYWAIPSTAYSNKVAFPPDFVITDFKKFYSHQGFIGSLQNEGMYGLTLPYSAGIIPNSVQTFRMSAVNRLTRCAFIEGRDVNQHPMVKAYAIGEIDVTGASPQRCIMEFYSYGDNVIDPYYYAPLAYNPEKGEYEKADDVIFIDNYVIFATRDSREKGHVPVNLRVTDTTGALTNGDIDCQRQFLIPDYYKLYSELRLVRLSGDDDFVLSYVAYDEHEKKYLLCIHKVYLVDVLNTYNTGSYCEIEIKKECNNLIDVIYEPDVSTLVYLLNGSGKSFLYHVDPYSTTSPATSLIYPDGELCSIDTMGFYLSYNANAYVAIGDSSFFFQDISNGVMIQRSCLQIGEHEIIFKTPPEFNKLYDPLIFGSGSKVYQHHFSESEYFFGRESCEEGSGNQNSNQ